MIKYEELKSILQKNRNIPYPSLPKLYPNKRYCNLIYNSFGGEKGELTAITQYIYEYMNFKKEKAISYILKDIAIEEMHHLDILGEIITTLGERPIYQDSNQKIWTANNVTYNSYNLKDVIEKNIKDEENAIVGYKILLHYTNNIYLRRIYERIILDETTHLEIFRKIRIELK